MVNYCTWNPVNREPQASNTVVLSNGNLEVVQGSAANQSVKSTMKLTGKQYVECKMLGNSSSTGTRQFLGIIEYNAKIASGYTAGSNATFSGMAWPRMTPYSSGSAGSVGDDLTNNQTVCFAVSEDDGKFWARINDGSWIGGGDPTDTTSTATGTFTTGRVYLWIMTVYDSSDNNVTDFGQNGYAYTAPSGYNTVSGDNLTAPTIPRPSDLFVPTRYIGTGQGQRVGDFLPFTDSKDVEFSCLFGRDSSQYMTRTPSGAGDEKKSTLSFWVKRAELGSTQEIFSCTNSSGTSQILFNSSNQLDFILQDTSGGTIGRRTTTMVFVDTTRWINIVCNFDCANTEMEVYVDGTQVTAFGTSSGPTNTDSTFNTTSSHTIGATNSPSNYFDGQLCEIVWTDGQQYDASSFGQTDTSSQKWIPKDVSGLTFGTNGFYLNMADGNDLGDDESGQGNDYTETNMDTTNKTNQLYDSPSHNFPMKFNPDDGGGSWTPTLGNLSTWATSDGQGRGNFYFDVTDWDGYYFEFSQEVYKSRPSVGIATELADQHSPGQTTNQYKIQLGADRYISALGSASYWGDSTWTSDDQIIGIHVLRNRIMYYLNGSIQGTDGTPPACGDLTGGSSGTGGGGTKWWTIFFMNSQATSGGQMIINTGQHMYLSGGATTWREDAGGYFKYAPPTGAKALQSDNMPTFGDNVAITSFNWIKNLDATTDHIQSDVVRGTTKYLSLPTTSGGQSTDVQAVQQFLPKGVGIGTMAAINPDPGTSAEGDRVMAWNWGATGTVATDSTGMVKTSDSSTSSINRAASTTSGFSTITYTGNGAYSTIKHGLGVAPQFFIIRQTDNSAVWKVWHHELADPLQSYMTLDDDATEQDFGDNRMWGGAPSTSTTIGVGDHIYVNDSGDTYVAWVWSPVEGFSSFGKYTGNSNSNGPFVYTGFRPAAVIIKVSAGSDNDWNMVDVARYPENNGEAPYIYANKTNVEGTTTDSSQDIDLLASGFKIRNGNNAYNQSNTYVYAAWAEFPFGGDGISQGKAR